MVAHLVHKDAEGNLAVVAVLLRQGEENPFAALALGEPAAEKEKEVAGRGEHQRGEPAAEEPRVLHVPGLAHHAAVQRGRDAGSC